MQDRSPHAFRAFLANAVRKRQPVVTIVAFERSMMKIQGTIEIRLREQHYSVVLPWIVDKNNLVVDVGEAHEIQFGRHAFDFEGGMTPGDLETRNTPIFLDGAVRIADFNGDMLHSGGSCSVHGRNCQRTAT